jgi:hypothetical protein
MQRLGLDGAGLDRQRLLRLTRPIEEANVTITEPLSYLSFGSLTF